MKKKLLMFICTVALAAGSCPVSEASLDPWVAYTTLSMGAVNSYVEYSQQSLGWEGITKFSGGTVYGVDLNAGFLSLRAAYMPPVTGAVWTAFSGEWVSAGYRASLTTLMVGKSFSSGPGAKMVPYIFVGYGIAEAQYGLNTSVEILGPNTWIPLAGSGAAWEVGLESRAGANLSLKIGYRYAFIARMATLSATPWDIDGDGTIDQIIPADSADTDQYGHVMPYDFGGVSIALSLKFGGSAKNKHPQYYGSPVPQGDGAAPQTVRQ